MSKRKPDTQLAKAIRDLQSEIDSKLVILKALREQYDSDEIDYYSYIQTEAWRDQRMKILRRDNFQCVCCGTAKNLHVHHITYENLGAEEEDDLVTLCADCHARVHNMPDADKMNFIKKKDNVPPGRLTWAEYDLLAYAYALGDVYLDLEDIWRINPDFFESYSAKTIAREFNEGAFSDELEESFARHLPKPRTDQIGMYKDMYFGLLYKVNTTAIDYLEGKLLDERIYSKEQELIDEKLKILEEHKKRLKEKAETL